MSEPGAPVRGMNARVSDGEIDRLLEDYRRVNNDEDLTYAEQEEALGEIADEIRKRQALLLEEEGHTGIG